MTRERTEVTDMLRTESEALWKATPAKPFDSELPAARTAARRVIKQFPRALFSTQEVMAGMFGGTRSFHFSSRTCLAACYSVCFDLVDLRASYGKLRERKFAKMRQPVVRKQLHPVRSVDSLVVPVHRMGTMTMRNHKHRINQR